MSNSEISAKNCTKCRETLPVESFCRNRKSSDGRHCWCRSCTREWRLANRDKMKVYQERYLAKPESQEKQKARRREYSQRPDVRPKKLASLRRRRAELRINHPNAKALIAAKSNPCTDCGNSYPHQVMELDHVRGGRGFSLNMATVVRPHITAELFDSEMAKCELRCPTCHRLRHYNEKAVGRPVIQFDENGYEVG